MGTFSGMDVEEVERLAARLDLQAKAIDAVVGVVDGAVAGLAGIWTGEDLDAFRAAWHQTHRPKATAIGEQLSGWVTELRRQTAEQRLVSGEGGAGASPGLGSLLGPLRPPSWADIAVGAIGVGRVASSWAGFVADFAETAKKEWDIARLPGGKFVAPALKGVGLGFSTSDLLDSIGRHDPAGEAESSIDMAATFVSAPVSLLWTGLSTEVGFALPLDSEHAAALYSYMKDQGYTDAQISQRWSGVEGFITYGNDNIARQAPWLIDASDRAMQKPAEWLYDIGIKL